MIPAISQVCTLHASFEQDVEDYASAACNALEIWLGKLEAYLDTHMVEEARGLLDAHQLSAPVASFQGGLLPRQDPGREEHWRHFQKRLTWCAPLGIRTIVVACDLFTLQGPEDLEHARRSLVQAADSAAEHGVRLALEFQAGAKFGNNLQTAAALIEECGRPNLGLCLDAFHFYVGPSKPEDLGLLTRDNLFHVQLCDLSGVPREWATDADRILPGEGDIPFDAILGTLRRIDYDGLVSLELFNPQLWQNPTKQIAEIGMTAMRKLLGIAQMT